MSRERKYNDFIPYNRPKLPRNKYSGLLDINSSVSNGSSLFGSSEGAAQVGVDMSSFSDFKGATKSEAGLSGLVPAPEAGENEHYLRGNGQWSDIPAARWFKEFPEGAGFEKTGLTIDGDLDVKKTLSTVNLNVTGAAHFWSLIIDKVKSTGGQLIVSPGSFHVDYVSKDIIYHKVFSEEDKENCLYELLAARKDISNIFKACGVEYIKCRRLYQRCDDGEKSITHEVEIGDMLRCRSFNIAKGAYRNVSNKDYWTFVVDKGEGEYTDEQNKVHKALYIDIAYTLRLQNGHNLPLGTKLKKDGTYEIPENYTEVDNILDLKKVSNDVLQGSTTVEEEWLDQEELKEVTDKVIKIRGIEDQISDLVN